MTFDYPARQFILATDDDRKGRGESLTTPVAAQSRFPLIEVEVEGRRYGFLLDTGASFSMVDRSMMMTWKAEHPQWSAAVGAVGFAKMFGGNADNNNLLLRLDKMNLGPFLLTGVAMVSRQDGTFEDGLSRMMSAPIIGPIGGNVLRDFRIDIDYRHGITYLQKKTQSPDTDLTGVGLVVQVLDGKLVITGIGSAAAAETKFLVHPNDRILAIDGQKVDGDPIAVVAELLSGAQRTHKRLSLQRMGEPVEVDVPVTKLL